MGGPRPRDSGRDSLIPAPARHGISWRGGGVRSTPPRRVQTRAEAFRGLPLLGRSVHRLRARPSESRCPRVVGDGQWVTRAGYPWLSRLETRLRLGSLFRQDHRSSTGLACVSLDGVRVESRSWGCKGRAESQAWTRASPSEVVTSKEMASSGGEVRGRPLNRPGDLSRNAFLLF